MAITAVLPEVNLPGVDLVSCAACHALALFLLPNGDFACPDGHAITPDDLHLFEPGDTWAITPVGALAIVTDPAAAYGRLCEARDGIENPDDSELADPHGAYREAVDALCSARALGLLLPAGAELIGQGR
ncbi:hypothetical protein AB0H51_27930 [Streptomyces griseoluteus]|uniref:hypothetical protein n=1 Tax=Streptomyces griseoluteus TaxID=29306 RepID=UPI0033CE1ED9